MCKQKHLIRMAGRIHRHLSAKPISMKSEWQSAATELFSRLATMERNWRAACLARDRGWHFAATARARQVSAEAARIEFAASNLASQPIVSHTNAPTLRTIVEELGQLEHEFEDVEIDLKQGLVGVRTDRIVLEEIDLGPFTIELHVGRLAERQGGECFKCIALEPNPAASQRDTVHPHVLDGHLCAGDATLPIQAALNQGRIADAFVLIRSVLQTYNADSPYMNLDHWSGLRCPDCDDLADSDFMYFCDHCHRDVCENCHSSCDICDSCCCRSCLETDSESGNQCCSACRHECSECERTVDRENFDADTQLCPACLEEYTSNQEQESNNHGSEKDPIVGPADATVITTAALPAIKAPAAA
jgi:hypothetical protein